MNNYQIITVATHSKGTFKELINNPYKNIKVLGFGQKWTGFNMKFELIYQYIKNMDNNKIIIQQKICLYTKNSSIMLSSILGEGYLA